jgi:hypothetical protein
MKVLFANASQTVVVVQVEERRGKPWVVVVQPGTRFVSRVHSLLSASRFLTGEYGPLRSDPAPVLDLVRRALAIPGFRGGEVPADPPPARTRPA